jgi:hypothetical protein
VEKVTPIRQAGVARLSNKPEDAMRYLVVLDPQSRVGAAYARGNNDGTTVEDLPVIDCSAIDTAGPFVICTRDSKNRGGSNQTVHVPHHAIAYFLEYAQGKPWPFGFVPAGEKKRATKPTPRRGVRSSGLDG